MTMSLNAGIGVTPLLSLYSDRPAERADAHSLFPYSASRASELAIYDEIVYCIHLVYRTYIFPEVYIRKHTHTHKCVIFFQVVLMCVYIS
jgi:ferredoxin-NADP reductase